LLSRMRNRLNAASSAVIGAPSVYSRVDRGDSGDRSAPAFADAAVAWRAAEPPEFACGLCLPPALPVRPDDVFRGIAAYPFPARASIQLRA